MALSSSKSVIFSGAWWDPALPPRCVRSCSAWLLAGFLLLFFPRRWAGLLASLALALLPGDDQPDATLDGFSTLKHEARHRLWQYRIHGGVENDRNFLRFAATLIGHTTDWNPPRQLLRAGLYWPDLETPDISALRDVWRNAAPVAVVTFYKALVQAGTLAPIDALIDALSVRSAAYASIEPWPDAHFARP